VCRYGRTCAASRERTKRLFDAFSRCWNEIGAIEYRDAKNIYNRVEIRLWQRKGKYTFGISIRTGAPDHWGCGLAPRGGPEAYGTRREALTAAVERAKSIVPRADSHRGAIFAMLPAADPQLSLFEEEHICAQGYAGRRAIAARSRGRESKK